MKRFGLHLVVVGLFLAPLARVQAASTAGTILILPFYEVDTSSPDGLTTTWSVRNVSTVDVSLQVSYCNEDAGNGCAKTEYFTLAVGETKTRNIRDVTGSVPATGSVLFTAWGVVSGTLVQEAIHGDYFYIEPGDSFASGGLLLRDHLDEGYYQIPTPKQPDLCSDVETRFFNGGSFSGGTDFLIFATWSHMGSSPTIVEPIVRAYYYDESGTYTGACTIDSYGTTNRSTFAVKMNSATLAAGCAGLPTFGTIVWDFANGVVGHVTVRHRALGMFSVSQPSFCAVE